MSRDAPVKKKPDQNISEVVFVANPGLVEEDRHEHDQDEAVQLRSFAANPTLADCHDQQVDQGEGSSALLLLPEKLYRQVDSDGKTTDDPGLFPWVRGSQYLRELLSKDHALQNVLHEFRLESDENWMVPAVIEIAPSELLVSEFDGADEHGTNNVREVYGTHQAGVLYIRAHHPETKKPLPVTFILRTLISLLADSICKNPIGNITLKNSGPDESQLFNQVDSDKDQDPDRLTHARVSHAYARQKATSDYSSRGSRNRLPEQDVSLELCVWKVVEALRRWNMLCLLPRNDSRKKKAVLLKEIRSLFSREFVPVMSEKFQLDHGQKPGIARLAEILLLWDHWDLRFYQEQDMANKQASSSSSNMQNLPLLPGGVGRAPEEAEIQAALAQLQRLFGNPSMMNLNRVVPPVQGPSQPTVLGGQLPVNPPGDHEMSNPLLEGLSVEDAERVTKLQRLQQIFQERLPDRVASCRELLVSICAAMITKIRRNSHSPFIEQDANDDETEKLEALFSRSVHRKIVSAVHPDKAGGSDDAFAEVLQALEDLRGLVGASSSTSIIPGDSVFNKTSRFRDCTMAGIVQTLQEQDLSELAGYVFTLMKLADDDSSEVEPQIFKIPTTTKKSNSFTFYLSGSARNAAVFLENYAAEKGKAEEQASPSTSTKEVTKQISAIAREEVEDILIFFPSTDGAFDQLDAVFVPGGTIYSSDQEPHTSEKEQEKQNTSTAIQEVCKHLLDMQRKSDEERAGSLIKQGRSKIRNLTGIRGSAHARKCFLEALEIAPSYSKAWHALAQHFLEEDDRPDPGQSFEEFLQAKEDITRQHLLQISTEHPAAFILQDHGMASTERIFRCSMKAIELDAKNADAWYLLGCTLIGGETTTVVRGTERVDNIDCFVKALEISPKHEEALEAYDSLADGERRAQDRSRGVASM